MHAALLGAPVELCVKIRRPALSIRRPAWDPPLEPAAEVVQLVIRVVEPGSGHSGAARRASSDGSARLRPGLRAGRCRTSRRLTRASTPLAGSRCRQSRLPASRSGRPPAVAFTHKSSGDPIKSPRASTNRAIPETLDHVIESLRPTRAEVTSMAPSERSRAGSRFVRADFLHQRENGAQ